MKNALVGLVGLVVLLGVAERAKADTIDFTFVSTPNSGGTYVDAFGTFTGNVVPLAANSTDYNLLLVDSGTITVVSNVPPTPFDLSIPGPRTPELNGSSDTAYGGSYLFSNTAGGVNVTNGPTGVCYVCFLMPGAPADGGDFDLYFVVSGINGAAGNSELVASDEGNHDYLYTTDGTLTLYGQVGNYQLTPEPASWLLLGSGVMMLGFVGYRKTAAV
jgi:hypothetical protein